MKDFAVRVYDSATKEMIIITDFSLSNVYKLREYTSMEPPMIASPYYDAHGERLFEKDVVVPVMKPRGYENAPWCDIKKFPTTKEEFPDFKDYDIEYYVVDTDAYCEWYLLGQVEEWHNSSVYKSLIRNDHWRSIKQVNENSIHYVKVGTVYSCSKIIEDAKKACLEKKEAVKREKELQCFMKLKAKYEGVEA